jgi:hypothetical protein
VIGSDRLGSAKILGAALTVYDGTSWENGTPLPPDFYGEIKS